MGQASFITRLRRSVERKLDALEDRSGALSRPDRGDLSQQDEPPVVARLVVEIRSDGQRTIARGALEDAQNNDRVALQASGTTPAQLAASLARNLVTLPLLARRITRGGF